MESSEKYIGDRIVVYLYWPVLVAAWAAVLLIMAAFFADVVEPSQVIQITIPIVALATLLFVLMIFDRKVRTAVQKYNQIYHENRKSTTSWQKLFPEDEDLRILIPNRIIWALLIILMFGEYELKRPLLYLVFSIFFLTALPWMHGLKKKKRLMAEK